MSNSTDPAFWDALAAELGPEVFAEPPRQPQEPYSVYDSIYNVPYSRFPTPGPTGFPTPTPDPHPHPTAGMSRFVSPTPAPESRFSTPGLRLLTPLPNEHLLPMSEPLRFVTPPLAPDYRYAHTPAPELPGFVSSPRELRSLSPGPQGEYGWMAPTPEPESSGEPYARQASEVVTHMSAVISVPATPRSRGRPRKHAVSTPAGPRTPSPRKKATATPAGPSSSGRGRVRRSSTAQDILPGPPATPSTGMARASSSASVLTRQVKVEMIEEGTVLGPDGEPITPRRSQRMRFPTHKYEGL